MKGGIRWGLVTFTMCLSCFLLGRYIIADPVAVSVFMAVSVMGSFIGTAALETS